MKYKALIAESWKVTQENKNLIWWFAFLPAVFNVIIFVGYFSYQIFALRTSSLFEGDDALNLWTYGMGKLRMLMDNSPSLVVLLLILTLIMGLLYLFVPVFTQGALIQLLVKIRHGQSFSITEGIGLGFRRFLQLFEYHLAIKTFSFLSLLTNAVFILRSLGPEAFQVFGGILFIVFIVGVIMTLLFTYSEYYICIDDQGMGKSMISSIQLVVRNWHHTLFMLILLAIISIRILFNLLFSLAIPFLVIGPIWFFAGKTLVAFGVIIGTILGLIAWYFSAYFLGVFQVFTTAVWTFTFLELTSNKGGTFREEVEQGV